jgi:hypothetical protein
MKKWYEWMRNHHDANDPKTEFVYKNLKEEIACVKDWIDSTDDYHVYYEAQAFNGQQYVKSLDDYYAKQGLTKEQIAEWIDDPEYSRLIEHTGIQSWIALPKDIEATLKENIRDIFPIDWDKAQLIVQLQRPGDMFPLHYDRFKNQEFAAGEEIVQRWVIMIHDQQPGQCFFMNDCNVTWKSGDVISWNQTNYSHGSANFGYYPRYSIRITGKLL